MYAGFHGWTEHKSCESVAGWPVDVVWSGVCLCQGVDLMLNSCPNLEIPLPLTILVASSEMYAGHSLIHSIHVMCCLRCIRSTCPFQKARFSDHAGCGDTLGVRQLMICPNCFTSVPHNMNMPRTQDV